MTYGEPGSASIEKCHDLVQGGEHGTLDDAARVPFPAAQPPLHPQTPVGEELGIDSCSAPYRGTHPPPLSRTPFLLTLERAPQN
jgi:hypothetical protein